MGNNSFRFCFKIYIHLKNRVPERDFFEYVNAVTEIFPKVSKKLEK